MSTPNHANPNSVSGSLGSNREFSVRRDIHLPPAIEHLVQSSLSSLISHWIGLPFHPTNTLFQLPALATRNQVALRKVDSEPQRTTAKGVDLQLPATAAIFRQIIMDDTSINPGAASENAQPVTGTEGAADITNAGSASGTSFPATSLDPLSVLTPGIRSPVTSRVPREEGRKLRIREPS